MCLFQHLHLDENGYVIRCTECGHYQFAFSAVVLTLSAPDFILFHELATRNLLSSSPCEQDAEKRIVLPTPYEGVKLLLNRCELQKLASMLDKADSEEKTQALMQLFTSP